MMTYREQLEKGKSRRAVAALFLLLGTLIAIIIAMNYFTNPLWALLILFPTEIIFYAFLLAPASFLTCPRCKGELEFYLLTRRHAGFDPKLKKCPDCGFDFDTEVESDTN